jgi:hypothetical protein
VRRRSCGRRDLRRRSSRSRSLAPFGFAGRATSLHARHPLSLWQAVGWPSGAVMRLCQRKPDVGMRSMPADSNRPADRRLVSGWGGLGDTGVEMGQLTDEERRMKSVRPLQHLPVAEFQVDTKRCVDLFLMVLRKLVCSGANARTTSISRPRFAWCWVQPRTPLCMNADSMIRSSRYWTHWQAAANARSATRIRRQHGTPSDEMRRPASRRYR